MAAQVGISGSTKVGKNCIVGGQAGMGGHIKIGDNAKIAAQSGVLRNVENGKCVMGTPAFNLNTFLRASVVLPHLPDIQKTVHQLQTEIAASHLSSSNQEKSGNDK
jgi:UDP-3-O-[3-hydroxymyristoyl] glucosamine N-acyltransferase